MLSLFLKNHETHPNTWKVLEGKQKEVGKSVLGLDKRMIFPSVKNPDFFSQGGLCFAFTSGILQSSELNSKSIGFGTLSGYTHLQ